MKLPEGYERIMAAHIPGRACTCTNKLCVYNIHGICDDPHTNHTNGDSACSNMSPRYVLGLIELVDK